MRGRPWLPNEERPEAASGWREALRLALYCIARYPRSFFGVGALSLVSTVMILPVPLISRSIINLVEQRGDPSDIIKLSLLALGAVFFERFVCYWHGVVIFRRFRILVCDFRRQVIDHLLEISLLRLQKTDPVTLSTRIFTDTENSLSAFYDNLISLIEDSITVVVCILAMAWIEARLSLLVLTAIPVYVVILNRFGRRIRDLTATYYTAAAAEKGLYHHLLAAPEIAKIYSHSYIVERYGRSADRSITAADDMMKLRAASTSIVGFIANILPILILLYGAFLIIKGTFDLGSFVAFSAFSSYMFPSLRRVVEYFVSAQAGLVALNRLSELLSLEKEERVPPSHLPDGSVLSLKDISFSYDGHARGSLEGVNMELRRGELIAIMGESGMGKTTLLKIITGLYDPTRGEILLDGRPVSAGARRSLTSYVEQEPLIFADTLIENIRLGREDVSPEDVSSVLHAVGLGDLLQESSRTATAGRGPTTITGPDIEQGGANLSLGQKKRISLTRALMKKSPIMVIDEPTAGLDSENAAKVMDTIRRACADRFVLIVSHNENAVNVCDRIYMVSDGHVLSVPSPVANVR